MVGGTLSWILVTRLATKVFHLDGGELIHASATVESVQAEMEWMGILRADLTDIRSSAKSSAPQSSKRGSDTVLTGATRDFEVMRDDELDGPSYTQR